MITVIVPAFNEARRIASTIQAIRSVPEVGAVVVVNDGSSDDTATAAASAGAQVATVPTNKGKAHAMAHGFATIASPSTSGDEDHVIVFLDADLQASASKLMMLAEPVIACEADMTIATLPQQASAGGGHGFVVRLAREGIRDATGWKPKQPLSGQRAVTVGAFRSALPLASGWGVEVGLSIDLLNRGFRLREVEVPFHHRVSGTDWRAQIHRGKQFWGVWRALRERGVGPRLPLPR